MAFGFVVYTGSSDVNFHFSGIMLGTLSEAPAKVRQLRDDHPGCVVVVIAHDYEEEAARATIAAGAKAAVDARLPYDPIGIIGAAIRGARRRRRSSPRAVAASFGAASSVDSGRRLLH